MESLQPKIRFTEFVANWNERKFGEIFTFRTTNSFSRDKLNYEKGSVKNIHYGDIHKRFNSLFDVKNEFVPYINEDVSIERISKDNYVKNGDLIIADASEDYDDIGKSIEVVNTNGEFILAGLHTFLARPELLQMSIGFNGYLMKTNKTKLQIKTIAQGTKVLSLSSTRLSKIDLNFPSLEEQTKIANFLTAIDEKINLLKEKATALAEYKKGMMQKIFNQELRFKDEFGKDYADWEEKSLGEIAKLQGGYAFKSHQFKNEGIPVIRISNISNSNNYIEENNMIFYDEIKNENNFCAKDGDLLLAMSGATTGKSCIYNLGIKGYVNQRVGLFVNKDDNILNGFSKILMGLGLNCQNRTLCLF
jgi:type I restriction enzyme S subunit